MNNLLQLNVIVINCSNFCNDNFYNNLRQFIQSNKKKTIEDTKRGWDNLIKKIRTPQFLSVIFSRHVSSLLRRCVSVSFLFFLYLYMCFVFLYFACCLLFCCCFLSFSVFVFVISFVVFFVFSLFVFYSFVLFNNGSLLEEIVI